MEQQQAIEEEQPQRSQFEQRLNLKKWDEDENEIRNFLKKLRDELEQSFIQTRLEKGIKEDEIQQELELAVKEILNKEQQLNLSLELAYVLLEKMSEQREVFLDEQENFQTQKEELEREIEFKDQYCGEYQRRLQYLTDQNGLLNKDVFKIEEQNEQLRGRNAALDQQLLKSLQHIEVVKQGKDDDTNSKLTMIHKELESYKLHNAQLSKELSESKKRIQTELVQSQECFAAIDDLRRQLSNSQKELDVAGRSVLELSLRLQSVQEEKDKLEADYFQLSLIHNRTQQGRGESKEGMDFESNDNNTSNNQGTQNRNGTSSSSPQLKSRRVQNGDNNNKQGFGSQIDDYKIEHRGGGNALFGELVDYQRDQGKRMFSGEDFFDSNRESSMDSDKFKSKRSSLLSKFNQKNEPIPESGAHPLSPSEQAQQHGSFSEEQQDKNSQALDFRKKQNQIAMNDDNLIEETQHNHEGMNIEDGSKQQQSLNNQQQFMHVEDHLHIKEEEEEEEEKKEIDEEIIAVQQDNYMVEIKNLHEEKERVDQSMEDNAERSNEITENINVKWESDQVNTTDQKNNGKQIGQTGDSNDFTNKSELNMQQQQLQQHILLPQSQPPQNQQQQVIPSQIQTAQNDQLQNINNQQSNKPSNTGSFITNSSNILRNGFIDSEMILQNKKKIINKQQQVTYKKRPMLQVLTEEESSGTKTSQNDTPQDPQEELLVTTSQFQVPSTKHQQTKVVTPSSQHDIRTPKTNPTKVTFADGYDDGNHGQSSDELTYISQSAVQPSQFIQPQKQLLSQQGRRKAHRKTVFMENMKTYKETHWGDNKREYQFQSLMANMPLVEETSNQIVRCPECFRQFHPLNSLPQAGYNNGQTNSGKSSPAIKNLISSFIQGNDDETAENHLENNNKDNNNNSEKDKDNSNITDIQQPHREKTEKSLSLQQQNEARGVVYFKSGLRNTHPQKNQSGQPNASAEFYLQSDTPKNTPKVVFAKEEDNIIDGLPSSSKNEVINQHTDHKELKGTSSAVQQYARNTSGDNLSDILNNRRLTGINKTQRNDPYEEFFMLTSQCVKLNSEYLDEIICLNVKPFYEEIKKLAIPYQKWNEFLTEKLNKIGRDMDQKNKQIRKVKLNLDLGRSHVFISPTTTTIDKKTQSVLKS